MPPAKQPAKKLADQSTAKTNAGKNKKEERSAPSDYSLSDSDSLDSQQLKKDETPIIPKASRKRSYEEEEGGVDCGKFGNEMQKMFESFGADMSKNMSVKARRLEQLTQAAGKSTCKRIEELIKNQLNERGKLCDEYEKQVNNVLTQWETDLMKTKEHEEKLQALFKQQQKVFLQIRTVQSQRLRTVRQLLEQFTKGLSELESNHHSYQETVQNELKKEMAVLQKKILTDTKQQEMASVRKSLQTMLF